MLLKGAQCSRYQGTWVLLSGLRGPDSSPCCISNISITQKKYHLSKHKTEGDHRNFSRTLSHHRHRALNFISAIQDKWYESLIFGVQTVAWKSLLWSLDILIHKFIFYCSCEIFLLPLHGYKGHINK